MPQTPMPKFGQKLITGWNGCGGQTDRSITLWPWKCGRSPKRWMRASPVSGIGLWKIDSLPSKNLWPTAKNIPPLQILPPPRPTLPPAIAPPNQAKAPSWARPPQFSRCFPYFELQDKYSRHNRCCLAALRRSRPAAPVVGEVTWPPSPSPLRLVAPSPYFTAPIAGIAPWSTPASPLGKPPKASGRLQSFIPLLCTVALL